MSKIKDKKHKQLGMNPSTASSRLVKDILFKLATEAGYKCFQCSMELTRDTFSIEHMTPWLDSEDPVGMFFDLENVAFSHLSCNIGASRTREIDHPCGTFARYTKGCRCDDCIGANAQKQRIAYNPATRRDKYAREKLKLVARR